MQAALTFLYVTTGILAIALTAYVGVSTIVALVVLGFFR